MATTITSNRYPNKPTLWAYFMQAIEPISQKINEAFPGYHPMWLIQSQKIDISAEQFKFMRVSLLRMTVEECAAYLRLSTPTIKRWENGKAKIDFASFELLRVVSESVHFRLSHKDWQGWFISNDGSLVSPDRGSLSFKPLDLSLITEVHHQKSFYEMECIRMRAELAPLKAELEMLRQADSNLRVLDELQEIEAHLSEIASRVGNKVIKLVQPRNKNISGENQKCA